MSTEAVIQPYQVMVYTFAILAVLLNGLLLMSMIKERKKMFVTRISFLVANLALADFLCGFFVIVLVQPIKELQIFKHDTVSPIILPFCWTAYSVSFYTVLFMAIERFIILILPMTWSSILIIPRTAICIVCAWCLSICGGVFIYYEKYTLYVQLAICLFVFLVDVFLIASHIYILWVLRRRGQRRIATDNQDPSLPNCSPPANENIVEKKVTIVITILLVALNITLIPYLIVLQFFLVNGTLDHTISDKINFEVYYEAYTYTFAFFYVNFFINPIIYAWRLRIYRKAFYSLLGRNHS